MQTLGNKENVIMKLHNIWGYGQLFGYSGLDGSNRYNNDFVGTLTAEKIGVRFELDTWITVKFPVTGKVKINALTGDVIDAKANGKPFFMTFAENDTLVGYSPVLPTFTGEIEIANKKINDVEVLKMGLHSFGVITKKQDEVYKFCIHHAFNENDAVNGANKYINADVELLKKQRYAYYDNMPVCKDKKYEQMYYKALSVNKVNVHTPEGKIKCTWTTPDRVPHRHMWLWDSVFHALAIVNYNVDLALSSVDAVMSQQYKDGFIPHMMNPEYDSKITQPQVLAWGVWELYKKTGDKNYLKKHADGLEKYLTWDNENRDKNGNGLLEWATNPDDPTNKCDECGQDDSPRFDFDDEMDAIDFSTFACRDAFYLSKIFNEIGDIARAEKWAKISKNIKDAINERLWCEEDGVYYDRLFSGEFSKVLTPSSFFPMMAGIPTKEQAEKMVKVLTDKKLLWTKCPLPTVAKNHSAYSTDMWRGGVWLNLNYFIIMGLREYGYNKLAEKLRDKSLKMVAKWYKKCGTIFEFFDPENKTAPYLCERKGVCPNPPDWRKHVHSIVDFNWSSCFTIMLIQKEYYGVDKK